jgi:predicted RNA-binding protein with PIN domain
VKEAEILRHINELEKLASDVLELKKRERPRRPIVIEFAGAPKAGKSTCISSLDIFLRRNRFRTKILTERAGVCPIPNKFDPLFNVWTGCASLNQLSETLARYARSLDVIILDRGFFDSLCWFEWQKLQGLLRPDEYERFVGFFTSPRFQMMIDLVLVFDANPVTSTEREYKNLLTGKEGSIMRTKVLESFRETTNECAKSYKKNFREIVIYKTDDQDQNTVSYGVTKLALDKLKNLADEKIGYIDKKYINLMPTHFNYSRISDVLQREVKFGNRNEIESDTNVIQLLPVICIKQSGRDEFVVGVKSKKSTSSRSPEKNKVLLYFGGHFRDEDRSENPSHHLLDALKQCAYREVKEEIGLDVCPTPDDPFCFWVRDGSKSEEHLAIVFPIERDMDFVKLTVDGDEFARFEKKGRTGTGDILNRKALEGEPLDSWSRLILNEVYPASREYYEDNRTLLDELTDGGVG